MIWFDELLSRVQGDRFQIINDSKTPSGRVHVGSLRGVLIHDAVFRRLNELRVPVRYLFGVDDFDPLDELPAGYGEYFKKYLGAPLCKVPPPPGSEAPDIAEHYIREFFSVFNELGVHVETYRMRDIYSSGKFNEAIDRILRNAATVRRIYREVSNSQRPDKWYPLQVICEECGRIGTTEVTSYDGKEVVYSCVPNLVAWATGCGFRGSISPFDGHGKLPWRLEWPAKWNYFGVTIEGAGKDHTTKGGSRDMAVAVLREVFDQAPPLNIPYEFFLVEGAKMSSSRGVGVSAREMSDFLPPEVFRFLMLRTHPRRPVNFAPEENYIVKLFNEFDRYHWRAFHDDRMEEGERKLYLLSEISPEGDFYEAPFQIVVILTQMPHLDLVQEIEKRKGSPLEPVEIRHLDRRVQAVRYWLEHYATEDEKIHIQEYLAVRAHEITDTQRAFLQFLADGLASVKWEDEELQSKIFDIARMTPIEPAKAFQAIYRVLLDKDSGPKAGNLLAFLDRKFVIDRFRALKYDQTQFWQDTGMTVDDLEAWLMQEKDSISSVSICFDLIARESELPPNDMGQTYTRGLGIIEFQFVLNDRKRYVKRVLFDQFKGFSTSAAREIDYFVDYAHGYVGELATRFDFQPVFPRGNGNDKLGPQQSLTSE